MDERTAFPPATTDELGDAPRPRGAGQNPDGSDDVDFASSRAAHGKMRLWLTVFTVAAAVAILAMVSICVLHGG